MEIIKKETHGNNLVQPEDNNINVMGFNVCLLLVQITVWIRMARFEGPSEGEGQAMSWTLMEQGCGEEGGLH